MAARIPFRPSPNHDERRRRAGQAPIRFIILHYTGMKTADEAEARLCDPAAKVSAHYLLREDGAVVQLVADDRRAWHAGVARWLAEDDLNSASLGIELQNPGHEWGYRPFPEAQIGALLALLRDLVARHGVPPARVLGHSDVAPTRKEDPGELFPWRRLARLGLALAEPEEPGADPGWDDAEFLGALRRFGYDTGAGRAEERAAVVAFQRHFRQQRVDGVVDGACRAILATLLAENRVMETRA